MTGQESAFNVASINSPVGGWSEYPFDHSSTAGMISRMGQILHAIFNSLTGFPYSFWFGLLLLTAPVLVFAVTPTKPLWLRAGRLLVAIAFTYGLLLLILGVEYAQSWRDYEACYAAHSELRDMSPERNDACIHHLERVPDSTAVFALLLGWIPAAGYAGFWELLWRIWHRKQIKQMGKDYRGKWFSNLLITFFLLIGAYALTLLLPVLCHIASIECRLQG